MSIVLIIKISFLFVAFIINKKMVVFFVCSPILITLLKILQDYKIDVDGKCVVILMKYQYIQMRYSKFLSSLFNHVLFMVQQKILFPFAFTSHM
jgi:hypothetical protein